MTKTGQLVATVRTVATARVTEQYTVTRGTRSTAISTTVITAKQPCLFASTASLTRKPFFCYFFILVQLIPFLNMSEPQKAQAQPVQVQAQPVQAQAQPVQAQAQPVYAQAQPVQAQAYPAQQAQAYPVQQQRQVQVRQNALVSP